MNASDIASSDAGNVILAWIEWVAGVPQIITQKGQSLDAAYLMPGYTSVVDMIAHRAGDWIYQCDVQARPTHYAESPLHVDWTST